MYFTYFTRNSTTWTDYNIYAIKIFLQWTLPLIYSHLYKECQSQMRLRNHKVISPVSHLVNKEQLCDTSNKALKFLMSSFPLLKAIFADITKTRPRARATPVMQRRSKWVPYIFNSFVTETASMTFGRNLQSSSRSHFSCSCGFNQALTLLSQFPNTLTQRWEYLYISFCYCLILNTWVLEYKLQFIVTI